MLPSMITKSKKNKNYQGIFYLIFFVVLTVGIALFLLITDLRIKNKRQGLINQAESLQREIQILEEKNANLKAGISQTQQDSYWEEKKREEGYKKPGETPVVILPPAETAEKTENEKSTLEKILDFLKFWEK